MADGQSSFPYVGSFLLGALVGGLAGALAGVLLAPKSGVETQAEIRQRLEEFREEANKTVSRARESIESAVRETREQVEGGARTRIADQMDRVGATLSQGARNIRPESIAK